MRECLQSTEWNREVELLLKTVSVVPASITEKFQQAYMLGTHTAVLWLTGKLSILKNRVDMGEMICLEEFGPLNTNSLHVWIKDCFPGVFDAVISGSS